MNSKTILNRSILINFFLGALLAACSPRLQSRFAATEDLETPAMAMEKATPNSRNSDCFNSLHYIPDPKHLEHTPIKYIRLNFHFVTAKDSAANWPRKKALGFAQSLLDAANEKLANNQKMWLPYQNDTPALPTRYRYILDPDPEAPEGKSVYRHFDDELCYYVHRGKNANLFRREVIKKYSAKEDSVVNIFIMPHHPDSVASPTYHNSLAGVTLGRAIKITGVFEHGADYKSFTGVLNHEMGHVLGLSHTWAYNDGCEDTPIHENKCWVRTDEPPCDTLASNNVMDYNNYQDAWTPCQIGRAHYRMSRENTSLRKLLVPNWRRRNPQQDIVIRDTVVWKGAKDLEGNVHIAPGGQLRIECRVSIPEKGKISIAPGGILVLNDGRLHNTAGLSWQGIEIQEQADKKGRIISLGLSKIENADHISLPDRLKR